MNKSADFRNKEVINISDGKRLGFVSDVDINFEKGTGEAENGYIIEITEK